LEALYNEAKQNEFALPAVNVVGSETINLTTPINYFATNHFGNCINNFKNPADKTISCRLQIGAQEMPFKLILLAFL